MKLKELINKIKSGLINIYDDEYKLECIITLYPQNYSYSDKTLSNKLLESDVVEIAHEKNYSSINIYIKEGKDNEN